MQQALYLTDGTTTADFLMGNARLAFDGYSMLEDYDEEGYVWETVKLINPASYTTDAEMRSAKKTIDDLLETARRYHNTTLEPNPVWLYCQSYGEQARRACVIDGRSEIVGTEFDSPLFGSYGLELNTAIRRGPWETDATLTNRIYNNAIDGNGDKWVIGNAAGSLNQRIAEISLTSIMGGSNTEAWIGIRPLYNGTGFQPKWEAEDLYGDIGFTCDIVSGSYSGGQALRIFFGNEAYQQEGMASQGTLYYEDVASGNYDHLVGRYLVLARCALDATTTECALQIRTADSDAIVGTQYITTDTPFANNNWKLYEMGEVQFPSVGNRNNIATLDSLKRMGLSIYAERLSDAGTLYVDYLLLIPSQHLIKFTCSTSPDYFFAYSDPDGKEYAAGMFTTIGWWNEPGTTLVDCEASFHNWNYPVGGGVLVMAAQSSNHSLTDAYAINMRMVPRWTSYRTE